MPCIRTYKCGDCNTTFNHFHNSSDDPYPECPACAMLADEQNLEQPVKRGRGRPRGSRTKKPVAWVPTQMNITGNKARAMDIIQDIAENDHGLSNFSDTVKEGETAAHAVRAETTADRERDEKAKAEVAQYAVSQGWKPGDDLINSPEVVAKRNGFFGGGAPGPQQMPTFDVNSVIQSNPSAAQRQAAGSTAMQNLHHMGKKGALPFNTKIMAKG